MKKNDKKWQTSVKKSETSEKKFIKTSEKMKKKKKEWQTSEKKSRISRKIKKKCKNVIKSCKLV